MRKHQRGLPFSSDFSMSLLPNTGIGEESSLGFVIRCQLQKLRYTGVQFDAWNKEKHNHKGVCVNFMALCTANEIQCKGLEGENQSDDDTKESSNSLMTQWNKHWESLIIKKNWENRRTKEEKHCVSISLWCNANSLSGKLNAQEKSINFNVLSTGTCMLLSLLTYCWCLGHFMQLKIYLQCKFVHTYVALVEHSFLCLPSVVCQ